MNPQGCPQGSKVPEEVNRPRFRYEDYAFLATDVKPAHHGHPTTMTTRTLADALPGSGAVTTEIDRITLRCRAGTNHLRLAEDLLQPDGAPVVSAGQVERSRGDKEWAERQRSSRLA